MSILQIVIAVFVLLELSNIVALYFVPGSKKANAVGVFAAWEKSKQYPDIHAFIQYLVFWVAGSKLIFILLLLVILFFGDPQLQQLSLVALALATTTFFWRLFPLIRKMDQAGEIDPAGYSKMLGVMIFVMIVVFLGAALLG